jgi:predicted signal transduction protein with EAL and GGDEF domain
MNDGGNNAEIVRAICTLAHNHGMEMIAEGIETDEQNGRLKIPGATVARDIFIPGRPTRSGRGNADLHSDRHAGSLAAAKVSPAEIIELIGAAYSMS